MKSANLRKVLGNTYEKVSTLPHHHYHHHHHHHQFINTSCQTHLFTIYETVAQT